MWTSASLLVLLTVVEPYVCQGSIQLKAVFFFFMAINWEEITVIYAPMSHHSIVLYSRKELGA